jgi:superfamily I DNA/RNA helicase
MPHEFGVFVRSAQQLDRARAAAEAARIAFTTLDDNVETTSGHVSIGTMHLAKGLEFRAVAVMACDDEIIPMQERTRQSATIQTCKKSTTPSDTCSMLHVHARAIFYLSRLLSRHPNFYLTSVPKSSSPCLRRLVYFAQLS